MAELNVPIYDFRSGVLTLKVKDRPNLDLYKSGILVGDNWLTQTHGPQEFRPGFIYSRPTRRNRIPYFITFSFDDNEAYVLEFTEYYMRILTNEGVVTETAKAITDVSNADPCVITVTAHGFSSGDEVYIESVGGTTDINGQFFIITVLDPDTFSIANLDEDDIDSTDFGVYTSGGSAARVYEIETPYREEDLRGLKASGKADLMYIDHPLYAPRKLVRNELTDWELDIYTRTNDPFEQKVITAITQANPGVVTANGHGFVDDDVVIIEDVTGMTEVNGNEYTVTRINDNTFSIVDTSGFTAYASGGIVAKKGNYPATVGFYGGRCLHGGSLNDPDVLHGSRSPNLTTGANRFEDFTVGADDDHAIVFPLTSASPSSVDRIRFFMGTRQFLAVGTYAGMLKVNGGSDSVPISGTAIESFPVDSYGVADTMPVSFGTDILYIQRGGATLFSFKYNLMSDGFESSDETLQADEIAVGVMNQLAYVQGKPNRIWASLDDGKLLSLTYNKGEDVSGWNTHQLADGGKVLTIAAEPQNDKEFRIWVAVERVVDGVVRRYIEYSAKNPRIPERDDFFTGTDEASKELDEQMYLNLLFEAQKRQVHMDSALMLDTTQDQQITPGDTTGDDVLFTVLNPLFQATDIGRWIRVKHITGTEEGIAEITEYVDEENVKCRILKDFNSTDVIPAGGWYFTQDHVSGLGHLEGKTVKVVADGGLDSDKVVENGEISFDAQTSYAIIGLGYFGRLKTMPLELLLTSGITPGKTKTVNKLNLMFRNSLGVSYGYDPYNLQRIPFRQGGEFTDRPTRLFSGVKEVPGFDIWGDQRSIWVIQTVPYPCTLNAMVADTEVEF